MLCLMGVLHCNTRGRTPIMNSECKYCGFNIDEYNRRIKDIRQNGLTQLNQYTRGYIVKKPKERR